MQNRLKPLAIRRMMENPFGQKPAIQRAIHDKVCTQRLGDFANDRFARAGELMGDDIGIDHRHTMMREQARHRGFPASNPTSESNS